MIWLRNRCLYDWLGRFPDVSLLGIIQDDKWLFHNDATWGWGKAWAPGAKIRQISDVSVSPSDIYCASVASVSTDYTHLEIPREIWWCFNELREALSIEALQWCRAMPFYYFYADVDIGSHGSTSYFQHDVMVWTKRRKPNLGHDERIMLIRSRARVIRAALCGTDLTGQTPAAPG